MSRSRFAGEFRDLHAHYLAPTVIDAIVRGVYAPHITAIADGEEVRFAFPTGPTRTMLPLMADLEQRVGHLDECGIDIQVLSTWIDMFGYDLPESVAVPYHRAVNEGMAAAVAQYPDRLRFYASVPLPWGAAAAAELEDAVSRLGAVGAMIGTNIGGRALDDPEFEPLWSTAERLGVPIELHPVNVAGADRLGVNEFSNFLGNPFDTTIAASALVFGGVLDRHPNLDVVLVHGGGYFAYAAGRLSHGRRARHVAPELKHEPIAYRDRFAYDTVVYDNATLHALVSIVGADRMVLGSDYPFDMEPPDIYANVVGVLGENAIERLAANGRRLSGGGASDAQR